MSTKNVLLGIIAFMACVQYTLALNITGGTTITNGAYDVHYCTSNCTITVTGSGTAEVLIVAGGGAGGTSTLNGPGGAGGVYHNATYTITAGTYNVVIGKGGKGVGKNGQNSSFNGVVAVGGGAGDAAAGGSSMNGGSGGGGVVGDAGGTGVAGQGYGGGTGAGVSPYASGGGGGCSQAGATGSDTQSGKGGDGCSYSITGTPTYYGGGGGGAATTEGAVYGAGGLGGGGDGAHTNGGAAGAGTDGLGGGGGGSRGGSPGYGGDGYFAISYTATSATTLTVSVVDSRTGSSVTGFNFNVTNGTSTWTGYCSGVSCTNSSYNFTSATAYFTNMTGYYNTTISGVSFNGANSSTVTVVAVNRTRLLNVRTYFGTATQTDTYVIGELQANQSYDFGYVARSMYNGSAWKHVTIMWNGTIMKDYLGITGTSSYPFSTNSTACLASGGNTCQRNVFFGGNVSVDTNGTPYAAASAGTTIDEIITAGSTTTSQADHLSPAFMVAWANNPTITYSGTMVSNLYAPSVNYVMSPNNPTVNDDSTATMTFSDVDYEATSTMYWQWYVNGSMVRSSSTTPTNGTYQFNDVLSKGNYTKGATVNLTVWASDGTYTSANYSQSFIIGGVRPGNITGFSCVDINWTDANCSWNNPSVSSYLVLLLNGSIVSNLSNTTTRAQITGLYPGTTYAISLYAVSTDGTASYTVSSTISTIPDTAPVITSYSPSNSTPIIEENATTTFSVNVTSNQSVIISWFKNNVFQVFGNFWNWATGMNDQGTYNVTALANDTYGMTAQQSWTVTVNDTYPAPLAPVFSPNGGMYRTYIPVSCPTPNSMSSVLTYGVSVSVNGGASNKLSENNHYASLDFDITPYPYGTTFTFNCTAQGIGGNASTISNVFTRAYVNEFYSTIISSNMQLTTLQPYTMSLYYDASQPTNNIWVQYAYADCNGDGLYDYVYNYTSYLPSRVKNYYQCVFPKGTATYEIGVFLQKKTGTTWAGSGCNNAYDYSDTCLLKKDYTLTVN